MFLQSPWIKLLNVLAHHGNHEIEETHGLDEGETQNGVGEKLATESRVAGDRHEESGEDETDTDTGTTETDGSGTHTQVLGDLNHGGGDLGGVLAAGSGLEGLAGVGLEDGGSGDTLGGTEGGDGGLLGGEGALGGSVQLEAGSGASDLGGLGHGGSQALGEDTGGHCDGLVGIERSWGGWIGMGWEGTFQGEKAGKLRKKVVPGHKYSTAQFSPVRLLVEASARVKKALLCADAGVFHSQITCTWNARDVFLPCFTLFFHFLHVSLALFGFVRVLADTRVHFLWDGFPSHEANKLPLASSPACSFNCFSYFTNRPVSHC